MKILLSLAFAASFGGALSRDRRRMAALARLGVPEARLNRHYVEAALIEGAGAFVTALDGGFVEGSPDDLPASRRSRYDQSGRNSKVLVKRL